MARIVPVIAVSRSLMERLMKSSVGKVQRRTWVRDSTGRKGHYRMQWVDPDHDKAGEGKDQIDLFSESEKKPEAYKPHWPEKGTFAGNGLGDNGREYEGYYEREYKDLSEFKPSAEPEDNDTGNNLMKKRRDELVNKISRKKKELSALSGEDLANAKKDLKYMEQLLLDFNSELGHERKPAGEVKKSILYSFRDGLAKAFKGGK